MGTWELVKLGEGGPLCHLSSLADELQRTKHSASRLDQPTGFSYTALGAHIDGSRSRSRSSTCRWRGPGSLVRKSRTHRCLFVWHRFDLVVFVLLLFRETKGNPRKNKPTSIEDCKPGMNQASRGRAASISQAYSQCICVVFLFG